MPHRAAIIASDGFSVARQRVRKDDGPGLAGPARAATYDNFRCGDLSSRVLLTFDDWLACWLSVSTVRSGIGPAAWLVAHTSPGSPVSRPQSSSWRSCRNPSTSPARTRIAVMSWKVFGVPAVSTLAVLAATTSRRQAQGILDDHDELDPDQLHTRLEQLIGHNPGLSSR